MRVRHRFGSQRLACQARLIDLQVDSLHENSVGGNFVARLHQDDVTHNNVAAGHFHHLAVASHLHGLVLVDGGEHTELARGVALKVEAYRRGNEDSDENAQRLHEVMFHKGQHQRYQCGYKKNLDDRITVFVEIELPKGSLLRRGEHIVAILLSAVCYLRVAEPHMRVCV